MQLGRRRSAKLARRLQESVIVGHASSVTVPRGVGWLDVTDSPARPTPRLAEPAISCNVRV
jgi:hypothetical protein